MAWQGWHADPLGVPWRWLASCAKGSAGPGSTPAWGAGPLKVPTRARAGKAGSTAGASHNGGSVQSESSPPPLTSRPARPMIRRQGQQGAARAHPKALWEGAALVAQPEGTTGAVAWETKASLKDTASEGCGLGAQPPPPSPPQIDPFVPGSSQEGSGQPPRVWKGPCCRPTLFSAPPTPWQPQNMAPCSTPGDQRGAAALDLGAGSCSTRLGLRPAAASPPTAGSHLPAR